MSKKLIALFVALTAVFSTAVSIAPAATAATSGPMSIGVQIGSAGKVVQFTLDNTANVVINWGDGSNSTVAAAANATHTYNAIGSYTITLTSGTAYAFRVSSTPAYSDTIISINDWGNQSATLSTLDFGGSALTDVPADAPTGLVDLTSAFANTSFNDPDIKTWDVHNVYLMAFAFQNSSFDQNIGSWSLAAATNNSFMNMFDQTSMTNATYSAILSGWIQQSWIPTAVTLGNVTNRNSSAKTVTCGAGQQARADLVAKSWTIADLGVPSCTNPLAPTMAPTFVASATSAVVTVPSVISNAGNYLVTALPGPITCVVKAYYASLSCNLTGLTAGASYTISYVSRLVSYSSAASPTASLSTSGGLPAPAFSITNTGRNICDINGCEFNYVGLFLDQLSKFTVNGKAIKVSNQTSTSMKATMPANPEGTYDILMSSASGNITFKGSVKYVDVAALDAPVVVTLDVPGFAAGSSALSATMKAKIKAFVASNGFYAKASCVGYVAGAKASKTDAAIAKARATNVCNFAKSLNSKFANAVATSAIDTNTGAAARRVELTFTK